MAQCPPKYPLVWRHNVTQSFLYTFVCLLQIILKKRLLKFDQELSACWKEELRFTLLTTKAGRILLAKFRWICLEAKTLEVEAIGVEAEAVCKYTAHASLSLTELQPKANIKLL